MSHFLIVEWDGKTPPTTWYNRLASFGIHVRGDKQKAPEIRREFAGERTFSGWHTGTDRRYSHYVQNEDGSFEYKEDFVPHGTEEIQGTVAQEGFIISKSYSLIRTLANEAKRLGAISIHTGKGEFEKFLPTKEDDLALGKVESVLGSRGRRTKGSTPDTFVITCHECVRTYHINNERELSDAINCPSCGSTKITTRQGVGVPIAYGTVGNCFDRWLDQRFQYGRYEISDSDDGNGVAATPARKKVDDVRDQREIDALRMIEKSKDFIAKLEASMTDEHEIRSAYRLLDAIFCARAYYSKEQRAEKRAEVLFALFKRGYNTTLNLLESGLVDPLDASATNHNLATYYARMYAKEV